MLARFCSRVQRFQCSSLSAFQHPDHHQQLYPCRRSLLSAACSGVQVTQIPFVWKAVNRQTRGYKLPTSAAGNQPAGEGLCTACLYLEAVVMGCLANFLPVRSRTWHIKARQDKMSDAHNLTCNCQWPAVVKYKHHSQVSSQSVLQPFLLADRGMCHPPTAYSYLQSICRGQHCAC